MLDLSLLLHWREAESNIQISDKHDIILILKFSYYTFPKVGQFPATKGSGVIHILNI